MKVVGKDWLGIFVIHNQFSLIGKPNIDCVSWLERFLEENNSWKLNPEFGPKHKNKKIIICQIILWK